MQHQATIQEAYQSLSSLSKSGEYLPAVPIKEHTLTLLNKCSNLISDLNQIKSLGDQTLLAVHQYTSDMQRLQTWMDKAEAFLNGADFKCSNVDEFNELNQTLQVSLIASSLL